MKNHINKILRDKAQTLSEALPYMNKFTGQNIVVKYGGSAMCNDESMHKFATDIVLLKQVGMHPIVVHGGGPQIGQMLKKLGVKTNFIDGLRITDADTVEVAEMVLSGKINGQIVEAVNRAGGKAIGVSGKDGHLIKARKLQRRTPDPDSNIEKIIDLGFVGEPCHIDTAILSTLIKGNLIPIIAPIGFGEHGETYNINADTVAGSIASAINAVRLILLTDVLGVLDKDKNLIPEIKIKDIDNLIKDGTISGGMIPKINTCQKSVKEGVEGAIIADGRLAHSILLELFIKQGIGTLVTDT